MGNEFSRRDVLGSTGALISTAMIAGCSRAGSEKPIATSSAVEIYEKDIARYIPRDAELEKLAEGFQWSEGPLWLPDDNKLLFTDVPGNTIYQWDEENGNSVFLTPSGPEPDDVPHLRAVGANGLVLGEEYNHIYMAVHGHRAVMAMDLGSKSTTILTNEYEGRKFNSPNDLVLSKNGPVYFTDPPFGLAERNDSPHKEQPVNGVYRVDPDGTTHLLIEDMTLPNGVALSPDEKTLYVTNSDGADAVVRAYDLSADGRVSNMRVFYDFAAAKAKNLEGAPDGMAIAPDGTMFVTGPGGVHIVRADGKALGLINPGKRVANCTFGNRNQFLYLTAHDQLMRLPVTL